MCQKAREFPPSEYPSSSFHNNTPYQSEEFANPNMIIEEKENDEDKVNSQINNNDNNNQKFYTSKKSFQSDTLTNQNTEKKTSNIIKFSTTIIEKKEIQPNIEIKNIKEDKKIKKESLRISYVRHFFIDLVAFINFLINKFNKKKGKNCKCLIAISTELFIKYGAEEAKKMLERKARDVLSEENDKNKENIKLIDTIINTHDENKNIELIEVLNKTIQELMNIYRNDKIHKDDIFRNFHRFPEFLTTLKKPENQKKIFEEQAMNYEKIINGIIENNCHPGPKPKNK